MNRIKRISMELLEKYPNRFGLEFDANKKTIGDVATVTSKVLRNELAGYITSHLRKEAASEKAAMTTADGRDDEPSEEIAEEE